MEGDFSYPFVQLDAAVLLLYFVAQLSKLCHCLTQSEAVSCLLLHFLQKSKINQKHWEEIKSEMMNRKIKGIITEAMEDFMPRGPLWFCHQTVQHRWCNSLNGWTRLAVKASIYIPISYAFFFRTRTFFSASLDFSSSLMFFPHLALTASDR